MPNCYNCQAEQRILKSKTVKGQSLALCDRCGAECTYCGGIGCTLHGEADLGRYMTGKATIDTNIRR